MKKDTRVDDFISKHQKWDLGLASLRELLVNSELTEDIKWGIPTYRLKDKNVVSFSGFKNHYGLWFHNGSFLTDEHNLLENAQEGKTRGMRHIKFTENKVVDADIIGAYILEAIQNQKDGKEIKVIRKKEVKPIPDLMRSSLSQKALTNLESLSSSKRNEYIDYITSAKRESTIQKRLTKINPLLEKGSALNDMYK